MADVDSLGINTVINEAIEYLIRDGPQRPIHVSFDVDALDDLEIPCTGTPGGDNRK
jgi:arginase